MHPRNTPFSADDFLIRNELPEILESHLILFVLYRCLQRLHCPERWPAAASSIRCKNSAMAWTDELVLLFVPRNCATQVGADRCQNQKLPLFAFRYINGFFGYGFAPAIDLFDLNGSHHRLRQSGKLAQRSKRRTLKLGRPAQHTESRA